MYYFKYHPGEKETVKIMKGFYITQKVLGEKVLCFKSEATKEQTDKLRHFAQRKIFHSYLSFNSLELDWNQTMLPNMIPSSNEILSHLYLKKQMKPEERIREENTK